MRCICTRGSLLRKVRCGRRMKIAGSPDSHRTECGRTRQGQVFRAVVGTTETLELRGGQRKPSLSAEAATQSSDG